MATKPDSDRYGFEAELRISSRPVIVVLVLLACLLYLGAEISAGGWKSVNRTISLSLVILALGVLNWALGNWHEKLGQAFTILSMSVAIYFASVWLDSPEVLVLAAVPVALATPLLHFTASVIVAIIESLLLVLLFLFQPAVAPASSVGVALVGIWGTLAATYATHQPVHQLLTWLEEYFERGQQFLEEARDRKAQLEQALDAFASANRQLALANERTTAMRAVAEEAQRSKMAFVANVSHEFRTPLNMIIGLAELMVESPEIYAVVLPPEMREDLKLIHRNCEHLSHMINDVLDLTRMEAGRLGLHRERVDLAEIIESSFAAVRPLVDKKQLFTRVSIPDDLPEVYCDHTRVQQVILNLVSNAARFTEHGGITIEIVQQEQQVQVSVRDTGTGISPEDLKTIFEPFDQGRLWHGSEGSGLGLSISKRFVELHGGRMWLESKMGVGTTFHFTLPISPPIQHVTRPGHAIVSDWVWREQIFQASRASYSDQLVKPRMIVCDDAGDLYDWFAHYSDDVEFVNTSGVAQMSDALKQAPAHAIVLNTEKPSDLLPMVQEARQRANGTPIIGYSIPHTVERAVDAGALGYLVKPVSRADLVAALQVVDAPVRRVLVVDDDPDVLQLFKRMLNTHDSALEVAVAPSGAEALRLLRQGVPDLMLLDVVMSDMDGWQVLEAAKADPQIQNVPTIFVSAQDLTDRPPVSSLLVATIDDGIPMSKLLRCSQELSTLLLASESGPDLMPG